MQEALHAKLYSEKQLALRLASKRLSAYYQEQDAAEENRLVAFEKTMRKRIELLQRQAKEEDEALFSELSAEFDRLRALLDERITRLRSEREANAAALQEAGAPAFSALQNEPLTGQEARAALLRGLLGGTGRTFRIEPPFRCDYGSHIYLGENFYANYELIVLDQCDVRFGDNVMLGPRVSLFSAGHPLDADIRNTGLEYGRPITVGSNVWMGGCVTVNGGVTIGDNVVIGSGSVVTHDIPSNVIAAGNPCRVLRPLTDADRAHWQQEAARWRAACGR